MLEYLPELLNEFLFLFAEEKALLPVQLVLLLRQMARHNPTELYVKWCSWLDFLVEPDLLSSFCGSQAWYFEVEEVLAWVIIQFTAKVCLSVCDFSEFRLILVCRLPLESVKQLTHTFL